MKGQWQWHSRAARSSKGGKIPGGRAREKPAGGAGSEGGQPPADGVADQGGRLVDVQLAHQPGPVGLDGFDAQAQVLRNVLHRVNPRSGRRTSLTVGVGNGT
jgi:hypothetical protein